MKPLIVDDDPSSSLVLNSQLFSLYKRATVVGTVKEALEICCSGEISIVFLDIYLKYGENGIDFLKKRQALSHLRIIPVVVLSAEDNVGVITQFYKEGANSFLIKPVQKNLVKEQLEMYRII